MSVVKKADALASLTNALQTSSYTAGSTHAFYLYPARFSPQIARTVIELFSSAGDYVLDPFMGGGTAIVEGLMSGRRMVGIDLNSLAHFVADTKTRPLSKNDVGHIQRWAANASGSRSSNSWPIEHVTNLPSPARRFLTTALATSSRLSNSRSRRFARCALLRLGQRAIDCRDNNAHSSIRHELVELVDEMLTGLGDFTNACRRAGIMKSEVTRRRQLFWGDATLVATHLMRSSVKPRLVFTSPPYPRVHVLYHRWQVHSRRETPAPYWIAQVPDGHYASHYTGGSRTAFGEARYFTMIERVFRALRPTLGRDSLVVQLVGFADSDSQLPRYLQAMKEAGFK